MMAKPMKTLELHYPMIQFLIICNKQIITYWDPDIVFIHEFLIPYRERARRLARSRYGIKNSWIKTISGSQYVIICLLHIIKNWIIG